MKRTSKKILLLTVFIATITLCFAFSAGALSGYGTCGDNLTYSYDSDAKALCINGTGPMEDFEDYYASPFYESDIETVVINSGVTSIDDWAFFRCYALKSVTIPDTVTSIGHDAFSLCTELASVNIPDSVKTIGEEAFYGCESLTDVTVGIGVSEIDYNAFNECISLVSITVDKNNKYYSSDEHGVLFDKNKTSLIKYPDNNSATSYSVPDGVITVEDFAFSGCRNTKTIILPDSVTTIGEYAFFWCENLTDIVIPYGVVTIGVNAFNTCEKLKNINLPNSITSIGEDAFTDCRSLTSITVPTGITTISNRLFHYCNSLTSVSLPYGVTTIGEDAFASCKSLTSITLPNSLTAIEDYAFSYCDSLKNITIPDGVTTIGNSAFVGCQGLTKATLPDSITKIGTHAFYNCKSLKDVYYGGTEAQWQRIKPSDFPSNVTVHFEKPSAPVEPEKPLTLAKPAKVAYASNSSAIKIAWTPVEGADGYRIFRKIGNEWHTTVPLTSATSYTFKNLKVGQMFIFAIRPYAEENGKTLWGDYATITTYTKPDAPAKVVSAQNNSAIRLTWTKCAGATGYRIYYKSGNTWKTSVSSTTANSHTYTALRPGARYTFAIRPYTIINGSVVWSDYKEYTAATLPSKVPFSVTSTSKGKISLSFSPVNGADGYQVYYKTGNGAYKLYKIYNKTGTLNFSNLKSGTRYTFAVRAGIRTSGGNIFGGYHQIAVTVK